MATLQKIRNRAGVLVAIIIGLALLAFILGDLLSSGQSIFRGQQLEVAEISGKSINIMDYNQEIDELTNFYKMTYNVSSLDNQTTQSIHEEVWRSAIRENILGKAYDNLGLQVSADELKTMLLGDSLNAEMVDEPHPIVRRMFTNPETGEFNRAQMVAYFDALTNKAYAAEKKRWIFLEDQIVDEKLSMKYFSLVRQGIQPSSLEAKNSALESSNTVDFSYAYNSFNVIPDEDVKVTDAEIKDYYDKHKESYKQEPSRSIEYVVFELLPSQADDQKAQQYIAQTKQAFQRTDNPVGFVNSNSDRPYTDRNYSKADLSEIVRDSVFNANPGFVAGPYFEDGSYKLVRLMEKTSLPDSVRARHILISLNVQRDDARGKAIADSLRNLIEKGADFNALAMEYSADQSNRQIGGDLGWFSEGMMVKPFNDAAFSAKQGVPVVVKTNFGYHILKVEAQSPKTPKVKLAILERQVVPSEETTQDIYSKAVQFGAAATSLDAFRDLCQKQNITPRFASDLKTTDQTIEGLDNARQIIRWAYEQEEPGKVSDIFDLADKYIVAAVIGVKEKGYADVESVKEEIEIEVRKDKKLQKLAENISAKLDSAGNIEDVARMLNTQVEEATDVRFINPYINAVGLEPAVVAQAFNTPLNQLSKPVIGENGVFVIVVSAIDTPENPDVAAAKMRLKYMYSSRATYEGYEALQQKAEIEDKRIKFF